MRVETGFFLTETRRINGIEHCVISRFRNSHYLQFLIVVYNATKVINKNNFHIFVIVRLKM